MFKMLPIKSGVGDSVQKHFLLYLYTISWHPDSNLLVYWHTAGAVADCLWQEWQRNNSHTSKHQWNLATAAYSAEHRKKRKTKLEKATQKNKLDSTRSKRRHRSCFKVMATTEGVEGPEHGCRLAGNELVSFGWKYCAFCSQHSWYWLCYSRMFLPKTNISSL